MDTKSCVTSLAISASSGLGGSRASNAALIDRFVSAVDGGADAKLSALQELLAAYDALKLDGQTASMVRALIEAKISAVSYRSTVPSKDDGSVGEAAAQA